MLEGDRYRQVRKESVFWGGTGLIAVIFFMLFMVACTVLGLWVEGWSLPWHIANQNRAFQESQAYNDGMAQGLADYRIQWERSDAGARAVIKSTIQQQYGRYPADRLSPELRSFLVDMRGF